MVLYGSLANLCIANMGGEMRQIKFRTWDSAEKKIIQNCAALDGYIYWQDNQGYRSCKFSDARFILMQFTGLQDKSGKEIWERDVTQNDYGIKFQIVWLENECCFAQQRCDDFKEKYAMNWNSKEVLCNIYNNPELLVNCPVNK